MTEPELDLLDYTAQVQLLIADLQKLQSASEALSTASGVLRDGREAIERADASLREGTEGSADAFDQAWQLLNETRKQTEADIAGAIIGLDSAVALVTKVGAILEKLENLQIAAGKLDSAQKTLTTTSKLLAEKASSLDGGVDHLSSAAKDIWTLRRSIEDAASTAAAQSTTIVTAVKTMHDYRSTLTGATDTLVRQQRILELAQKDLSASTHAKHGELSSSISAVADRVTGLQSLIQNVKNTDEVRAQQLVQHSQQLDRVHASIRWVLVATLLSLIGIGTMLALQLSAPGT